MEAAFLSRGQAARMRAWLRVVVGRRQGGGDANGVGPKEEEEPCVTVLSWEGNDEGGGHDGWWGRVDGGGGVAGGVWVGGEGEEEDGGSEGSEEGSGDGERWGGGW